MSKEKGSGEKPKPASRVTNKDQLEYRGRIWLKIIDAVAKTMRHGMTCGVAAFVAWMLYLSVDSMAGKSTDFRSVIDWAVKMHVSEGVAWATAAVCGVGCYNRHQAFRKLARQTGPRMKELEEAFDAARSTSGLTPNGDSPTGDE